jgi:hypothetical protein
MVYFQTKKYIYNIFLEGGGEENIGIFYGHLV